MPRDSNGNYTLPSTGNPVLTATTISSTWANTTFNDLATEMTDSLDRSGKGGMLAAFKVTDGTVGAPGLAFTLEPTTGWYRAAANNPALSIGGVEYYSFTLTGVSGPAFIVTGSTVPTNGMYLSAANTIAFATNSTEHFSIDANGEVIINCTGGGNCALTILGATNKSPLNITSYNTGQNIDITFSRQSTTTKNTLNEGTNFNFGDTVTGSGMFQYAGGQYEFWTNPAFGGWRQVAFWDSNYQFNLDAPPGGDTTIIINGSAAGVSAHIISGNAASSAQPDLYITRAGSSANSVGLGPCVQFFDTTSNLGSIFQQSGGQTEIWQYNGSWVQVAYCGSGHNFNFLDDSGTMQMVGWRDCPQNTQNANYTTVLADRGKQIYHNNATAYTWTVPANSSVAYPVGTTILLLNDGSGNITVTVTTDTLVWAGSGSTGSCTLSQYGFAILEKVASTRWYISGIGLS